jgi:uridine kinase
MKEGKSVMKPIYNHVTGLLDPPEETSAPNILIIEGLHPFYDDRVNELVDFRIYLDISGGCGVVVQWGGMAEGGCLKTCRGAET